MRRYELLAWPESNQHSLRNSILCTPCLKLKRPPIGAASH